jgi:hypothetical protein
VFSLLPPRSYHAVLTIDSSPDDSNSALLQGFFFDTRYGMRRMLAGMVECAMWHRCWTNVLYRDRFKLLAFLLEWHAQSPATQPKFTDINLHALLFAAKYSAWLLPLSLDTPEAMVSYDPQQVFSDENTSDVLLYLTQRGIELIASLPSIEYISYQRLEREFIGYLAHEFKALKDSM